MKLVICVLLLFTALNLIAQIKDTLVPVENHSLNFKIIEGIGTPIIFESGAGNEGTVWVELMKLIRYTINIANKLTNL